MRFRFPLPASAGEGFASFGPPPLARLPFPLPASVGEAPSAGPSLARDLFRAPLAALCEALEPRPAAAVRDVAGVGDVRTQLHTSNGTGFWGPPLRVFARSEITLLTLHTG